MSVPAADKLRALGTEMGMEVGASTSNWAVSYRGDSETCLSAADLLDAIDEVVAIQVRCDTHVCSPLIAIARLLHPEDGGQ
jgi:hypothetical protein